VNLKDGFKIIEKIKVVLLNIQRRMDRINSYALQWGDFFIYLDRSPKLAIIQNYLKPHLGVVLEVTQF
jgi:hypothetical protein